jgi:TPR repeat protein
VIDISGIFSVYRALGALGALGAPARFRSHVLPLSLALLLGLTVLAGPAPVQADSATGWQAHNSGDYTRADAEWRPMAEAGSRDAQFAMGMLAEAQGYTAAALEWYERAARQGQTAAQVILGARYATGMDVEVDLVRAWYWLDRAARRNHPNAAEFRDTLLPPMTWEERALIDQLGD